MATSAEKMMKDCLAALNSHDAEKVASFCTEDVVFDLVGVAVTRGKKEAKTALSATFAAFPDVKKETKSFFSAGDRAACEWVETGTQTGDWLGIRATGKSYSIRGVWIIELGKGKTSRVSSYWNMADFLQQLGLMPKTPP
jgi:steroid delta-isomerase-like uncharacterized protein